MYMAGCFLIMHFVVVGWHAALFQAVKNSLLGGITVGKSFSLLRKAFM
jgi:hypothetical protein